MAMGWQNDGHGWTSFKYASGFSRFYVNKPAGLEFVYPGNIQHGSESCASLHESPGQVSLTGQTEISTAGTPAMACNARQCAAR